MAQRTSGWRSVLSDPRLYALFKSILATPRTRRPKPKPYIRPVNGMRILDLGCGPAKVLAGLPKGVEYVGVDMSKAYIEAAKQKYGNRGTFFCLPIEDMESPVFRGFDLVLGLGVLHHLDDEPARRFFNIAYRALTDCGRCLTVDPCRVPGQHPIARLLIHMDRGQNVRTADGYAALAKSAFSKLSQEIRHDRMRLPYTHHIMECRKK